MKNLLTRIAICLELNKVMKFGFNHIEIDLPTYSKRWRVKGSNILDKIEEIK